MPNRTFDEGRKAQGFTSQAHLDAFYAYYDHTQSCPECQKPGEPYDTGDGLQPTMNQCAEGLRLFALSN